MAAPRSTPILDRPDGSMGQVHLSFAVENSGDLLGPARPVRRIELAGIVMDTGATHLCLPADLVETLGLPFDREVPVKVATGYTTRRIFRDALVIFEDRRTQCECVELPAGMPALLGAIPMEGLGIEPDLQARAVRKLELGPGRSYITA